MSGWNDWQQHLEQASDEPGEAASTSTATQAARPGRRARRRAARAAQYAVRRGHLRELESAPGIAMLVLAVVVIAAALWLRTSSNTGASSSDSRAAASPSPAPADASPAGASPRGVTLDPHTGAPVLPPRGMPPAPGDVDPAVLADPLDAAVAFAQQACARLGAESDQQYRARIQAVSTAQFAASWQPGDAQRIGCLQVTATLTSTDPTSAVAALGGVQVYPDPAVAGGLQAYRWSAVVTLSVEGAVWRVSA